MIARLFSLLRPVAGPLGRRGERVAEKWLKRHGYRILERNLKIGRDEIDLLAIDPDGMTLVLVEVKTASAAEPDPIEHINHDKQHHITRLAAQLKKRPEYADRPLRFDAIGIVWPAGEKPQVRHYEGAFDATI